MSRRSSTVALLLAVSAAQLVAQERRQVGSGDPEAQLMGYFAAVLQLTPVGLPARGLEVGGDLSWIPFLSESERRVGFGGTKLEQTNFCRVLPRLRLAASGGAGSLEAGYVPPIEVCGVEAHLFAASVLRRFPVSRRLDAALRASLLQGRLEAAITCGAAAIADPLDLTCFRGRESADRVRPLAVSLEGVLARRGRGAGLEPYILAGVRSEQVRFEVNFVRDTAFPAMNDQQQFEATLTRVHAAVGAAYRPGTRLRLGAELFYAPGALLTVRGRAALVLGQPR